MTTRELTAFCDVLNAEAIAVRDAEGLTDYQALLRVAGRHDLRRLTPLEDEDDNPCGCVLYRTPDGTTLNLWLDATEGEICEGGLGFDDNTDWHED